MKELYREIKINKHGLRFLPKLNLSGLAEVVYFYLLIKFLHAGHDNYSNQQQPFYISNFLEEVIDASLLYLLDYYYYNLD